MKSSPDTAPAEWGLANSRFSLFSPNYKNLETADYAEIFGFEAENQTISKAQFLCEFSTTRDGTIYQLSAAGPKIDIVITAGLQLDKMSEGLPMLHDPTKVRELLKTASSVLLSRVADVRRLAIGEQMLLPAGSRPKAYALMQYYLPALKIDPEKSSDLFYRINRPRKIDVQGRAILVNRLSQWGCLLLSVTMTASEMNKTAAFGEAVSVITDVNSAADDDLSTLTIDQKEALVDTLFAFSKELAQKGDYP